MQFYASDLSKTKQKIVKLITHRTVTAQFLFLPILYIATAVICTIENKSTLEDKLTALA